MFERKKIAFNPISWKKSINRVTFVSDLLTVN